MACWEKVLVVVVVVFLGLVAEQQVTFVNGDGDLVIKTCLDTPNDSVCGECMKSEPGVLNEDLKGLGRRTINCTSLESKKALEIAKRGANSSSTAETIDAYYFCIYRLTEGDLAITDAYKSWQDGRYADAGHQVMAGVSASTKCYVQFNTLKDPEHLVYQILTLQDIQQVSAAVLSRIH